MAESVMSKGETPEMGQRLTVREMFALRGQSVDCDAPFPSHVATDSRDVRPEGAFVALEGERTDGHLYIGRAVENGAALIIARKGKCPVGPSAVCVELEEPEKDLGELAARYADYVAPRERIAVTGSVGKTTTREAIACVLGKEGGLHAAERSFNTVIGCSSTILTMPLGTQLLLLEFGANSMGEIRNLTRLFLPTTAVLTQVASVHLAGFGSIEGVRRATREITESPVLRNFIYGADNSLLRKAAAELSPGIRRFGVGREYGDYRIEKNAFTLEGNSPALSFQLKSPDGEERFRAAVWGVKLADPVAFGAVVGNALGLSLAVCAKRLASFAALKGRGRILSLPGPGGRFIVDDAYNANPVSMRSSLETFIALDSIGRKVAVLGDMRELGENENRYHEELSPLLEKVDRIVFVGEIWRASLPSRKGWDFVSRWQEAAAILENELWNALLVKGSNSHRLGELVESLSERKDVEIR